MRGTTPLLIFTGIMNADFYQNKILKNCLLPFVNAIYPEGHRLYQDNDPKHTAKTTVSYMENNGINWWRTPPESPDINPIENLWREMKYYVEEVAKPMNRAEFIQSLHAFWATVDVAKCQKYISHIHKVLPAVIAAEGKATKF